MFEGFAHVWTPVTLAHRLRKGRPLAVTLAGEQLVFFRDAKGQASALLDRCPHRGVALSLGAVKDGCLECPFHAWRFDGAGACVSVPLNPDAKRERLFATALPTRELAGLLWVYTAPVSAPPSEPRFPETLTRSDLARTAFEVTWKAHWTRAMENMLDSPHVPFLHRRTIGRFVRPYLRPDSRMDVDWNETSFGATLPGYLDGDRSRDSGNLEFWKPNLMVLNIMPNQAFRIHALCVPAEENHVRMIIIGTRNFARLRLLNPLFNWSNKRITEEDRAVVESSWPMRVPPPAEERSVRTDRATLQFRRYFFETLAASRAEAPVRSLELTAGNDDAPSVH
jgi:phenylpropionate dioxygenase-like ring-hydroxylating dioxygenase large terminal subunit